MKKLIMLVTLSLGAFVFAGDEDGTAPSVPNCPPTCGVKPDKTTSKKPTEKVQTPRTNS